MKSSVAGGFSPASVSPLCPAPAAGEAFEVARPADAFVDSLGVGLHLEQAGRALDGATLLARLRELGFRHVVQTVKLEAPDEARNIVTWLTRSGARVLAQVPLETDVRLLGAALGGALEGATLTATAARGDRKHPGWQELFRSRSQSFWRGVQDGSTTVQVLGADAGLEHAADIGSVADFVDHARLQYSIDADPPGGLRLEAALVTARAFFGPKPVIAPSAGYSTTTKGANGVSEAVQSKYLGRLFFELWNHGVIRTYLKSLQDPADAGDHMGARYGLVRADGTAKPAFAVLRDLAQTLGEAGPAAAASVSVPLEVRGSPDVHQSLLFKRDGRLYLALWRELRSTDLEAPTELDIEIRWPLRRARLLVPGSDGAGRELTPGKGTLRVPASDRVTLVELSLGCAF